MREIEPKRLVFLDETGLATTMTPAYGWAPRGERAVGSIPKSWKPTTLIAAVALDGAFAPLAFPGALDATAARAITRAGAEVLRLPPTARTTTRSRRCGPS